MEGVFGARVAKYVRGRVLEVGCGVGRDDRAPPRRVADRVGLPRARRLTGKGASATLAANPSPVPTRIVVGDIGALDPAERFDCILYIDVLEHIEDDTGELARAARFLAKDGSLVVLCPAFQFCSAPWTRRSATSAATRPEHCPPFFHESYGGARSSISTPSGWSPRWRTSSSSVKMRREEAR